MFSRRRTWLERIANWGTALAVPVVAIIGFKLLAHARDAGAPVAGAGGPRATAAAAAGRVVAPPIDAGAPPVVELRPPPLAGDQTAVRPTGTSSEDRRCAALEQAGREAGEAARLAVDPATASLLRGRREASLAEARALACPGR